MGHPDERISVYAVATQRLSSDGSVFRADRGKGPGWGDRYSTAFRMVSTAAMRARTSDKSASMAPRLVAICD